MKSHTVIALASSLAACGAPANMEAGAPFEHDAGETTHAWTHERFDTADDRFTFAVFADLTGGEREGIFELAVAQLNLLRPELIINVGDLIEGDSTSSDGLHDEGDRFDERAGKARAPVFYVGGNHDLTGRLLRQVWTERYGELYYQFRYRDVLFLVLDTEDNTPERIAEIARLRNQAIEVADTEGREAFEETEYGILPERSAGNITGTQSRHFVRVLAENADVRWTFLFMHKPVWKREDDGNFAAIEAALAGRPYTVFHGHEHICAHEQRHGRDYIRLATTGCVSWWLRPIFDVNSTDRFTSDNKVNSAAARPALWARSCWS